MVKNPNKEDFDDRVVEIEDSDPSVAPSKGGKTLMVAGVILGIALIINFFILPILFGGDTEEKPSQDIVIEEGGRANVVEDVEIMERETFVPPIIDDDFSQTFEVPTVPELPELPELSEEVTKSIEKAEEERQKQEEEFEKRLTEEREKQELATKSLEEKIKKLESRLSSSTIQPPKTTDTTKPLIQGSDLVESGFPLEKEEDNEASLARKRALAQRKATAMLTKTGGGIGPKSSFIDGGGIILSQENTVKALEESVTEVTAQRVKDLRTTILQGKLIYAILETAINTDFEGTLRGVVTKDVYAEKGSHILISKGSRLIGSYESNIIRGQHRLMINWSRIIRTDGVEIAISSQTTDQFGRAGLQGEVDNKYVEILGNSLLTSILTVATAVATEEVTGSTGVGKTTSTDTGSSTQTEGKASDFAIIDATESFLKSAESLVEDLSKSAKPTMRIPQGTKLLVFVNQDLSIPPIEE
ncbi:TrbI/VirB10 family protein [Pseudomonadota bacterium]